MNATASNPFRLKVPPPSNGGEVPPAGSHAARLVALVDLGTHEDDYQGKKSWVRKVLLAWELTDEKAPGTGRGYILARDYNLTFGTKSALRQMVERWRGKPLGEGEEFDLTKMIGQPCLLTLTLKKSANSGNEYAKIDGLSPLPRGMTASKPSVEPLTWMIDSGEPEPPAAWLPYLYGEPLKDVIARSQERRGKAPAPAPAGDSDANQAQEDEIPF